MIVVDIIVMLVFCLENSILEGLLIEEVDYLWEGAVQTLRNAKFPKLHTPSQYHHFDHFVHFHTLANPPHLG